MAVSGILSGSCPRAAARAACLALCLLALAGTAAAQDPNECDEPGDYPDLTLGELESVVLWGPVDGISAYSIGAATCNLGTCWANWLFNTDQHPVFASNLFRLKNGRFEQIGQSWATPGEVTGLLLDRDGQDRAVLDWSAPAAPGSLALGYEAIRSTDPGDFLTTAVCLSVVDPTATTAVDAASRRLPLALMSGPSR